MSTFNSVASRTQTNAGRQCSAFQGERPIFANLAPWLGGCFGRWGWGVTLSTEMIQVPWTSRETIFCDSSSLLPHVKWVLFKLTSRESLLRMQENQGTQGGQEKLCHLSGRRSEWVMCWGHREERVDREQVQGWPGSPQDRCQVATLSLLRKVSEHCIVFVVSDWWLKSKYHHFLTSSKHLFFKPALLEKQQLF